MKNRRDVCKAQHAGYVHYEGLQGILLLISSRKCDSDLPYMSSQCVTDAIIHDCTSCVVCVSVAGIHELIYV